MIENKFTTEHVAGYLEDSLIWNLSGISWVIIGAQTKPYKPPKIEWVQEIVEACDKAGIPVFLKNNLAPLFSHQDRLFFNYDEDIPEMLKLRQEIP